MSINGNYQQLGETQASAPAMGKSSSSANSEGKLDIGYFTSQIGTLPFIAPNVSEQNMEDDITQFVNGKEIAGSAFAKSVGVALTCATGIGCFYVCAKMILVKRGDFGFTMNNGKPQILRPGRHILMNPLNSYVTSVSSGKNKIEIGPVSIIRIRQGNLGFASSNGTPEILLPGVHIRNAASWKFDKEVSLSEPIIEYGPIKILTVRSGTVQVCYHEGKVQIYSEGRYAINAGTWIVAEKIPIRQQNIRFSQHSVLLDGGIGMLVEGLLTFQVDDVESLIKELGDRDLTRAIEDVTKAELSRVFSTIHLEQLASSQAVPTKRATHLLGSPEDEERKEGVGEGETRTQICASVITAIRPFFRPWGVKVINFQLESTRIADQKYAQEYEEASLGLAKAKANMRSIAAQNDILIQKANAEAKATTIKSEAVKASIIIEAEGRAEARRIEAQARNDAAQLMDNDFAKQFALAGQQVDFAGALKATSVTVLGDTSIGKNMSSAFVLPVNTQPGS